MRSKPVGRRLLRIVQETANRWRIENDSGFVLVDGLMIETEYRAEQFIKGYVSSYLNFGYEVITINKGDESETRNNTKGS